MLCSFLGKIPYVMLYSFLGKIPYVMLCSFLGKIKYPMSCDVLVQVKCPMSCDVPFQVKLLRGSIDVVLFVRTFSSSWCLSSTSQGVLKHYNRITINEHKMTINVHRMTFKDMLFASRMTLRHVVCLQNDSKTCRLLTIGPDSTLAVIKVFRAMRCLRY